MPRGIVVAGVVEAAVFIWEQAVTAVVRTTSSAGLKYDTDVAGCGDKERRDFRQRDCMLRLRKNGCFTSVEGLSAGAAAVAVVAR